MSIGSKYGAHYLIVKDEFCLFESCKSLFDQGVMKFFFHVPVRYWDGTGVSERDINQISNVANKVRKHGTTVMMERIEPPQKDLGKYALAEAEVRNACLKKIDQAGVKHILIVDADEIWLPGSIKALNDAVLNTNENAVSVRSLPVIGCPGYPVDNTSEGLLAYVRYPAKFLAGRSPTVKTVTVDYMSVIHFTSTRKTYGETIEKHLKSCHYGDRNYLFDEWLRDQLPKIKPGEEISHMYKHRSIWEKVRHFTEKEWKLIPETLRPYLGGTG